MREPEPKTAAERKASALRDYQRSNSSLPLVLAGLVLLLGYVTFVVASVHHESQKHVPINRIVLNNVSADADPATNVMIIEGPCILYPVHKPSEAVQVNCFIGAEHPAIHMVYLAGNSSYYEQLIDDTSLGMYHYKVTHK